MQEPTPKSRVREEDDDNLEEIFRKYCDFRGLNPSQSGAVRASLMSPTRGTGRRVHLIQGPPGTGKKIPLCEVVHVNLVKQLECRT